MITFIQMFFLSSRQTKGRLLNGSLGFKKVFEYYCPLQCIDKFQSKANILFDWFWGCSIMIWDHKAIFILNLVHYMVEDYLMLALSFILVCIFGVLTKKCGITTCCSAAILCLEIHENWYLYTDVRGKTRTRLA